MNIPKKQAVFQGGADTSAGAYSPGLAIGDLVFVSGQGPLDPKTGKVVPGDIEAQTELTLSNVKRILEAAHCTMDDCVKTTVHLNDIADFQRFNKVYGEFFNKPYPTRTTVQSGLLGILVEIDVVAIRGTGGGG